MKTILILAALMISGNANAQILQRLGDEFRADSAKLPALNRIMSDMTDDNIAHVKEYNAYVADQQTKRDWASLAIAEQERTVKAPMEAKSKAEADRYTEYCSGSLSAGLLENCAKWKERVEQDVYATKRQWNEYSARWNAEHITPVNTTLAKQGVRMKELATLVDVDLKRFADARENFILTRKRMDQILLSMKHLCDPRTAATKDAPFTETERRRWCSSSDLDGMGRIIPPMYKP